MRIKLKRKDRVNKWMILTFHHDADDAIDGGRNVIKGHALVDPVTVSRDVVYNQDLTINPYP